MLNDKHGYVAELRGGQLTSNGGPLRLLGRHATISSVAKLLLQDLIQLSDQWMCDARVLEKAMRFAGAYHAGGLALECMLKAKIAASIQAEEFPDKKLAEKAWGHDPAALLKLGDLERSMDQADSTLTTNWATVKDWSIASRYVANVSQATVTEFLDALDNSKDGVLPWLRNHFSILK